MGARSLAVYGGAALLALGGVLALPAMIPRTAVWRRASRFSAMAGLLLCAGAGLSDWVRLGRPPVASGCEMLLMLAAALAAGYVVAEGLAKSREAGLPLLLLAAGLALFGESAAPEGPGAGALPLAMRGPWMPLCFGLSIVAYGFLFAAGVQAVALLVVREFWPRHAERAGRAVYWLVCLGFPFLLLSMMVFAVWSQRVRGVHWGWGGRELWALAYCLALLAYLNLHLIAGWRERRAAWFLLLVSLAGLGAFASTRRAPTPQGEAAYEQLLEKEREACRKQPATGRG
ncbi:MAG: cytochrome c biogenesis protein CcsA [Planctomycetota bacterium]